MSPKQHGTRPSASMQFENDRNTQRRMMSGYILFTSCRMRWKQQTVSPPTVGDVPVDRSKKRKNKKTKLGGAATYDNTPSDPMTTHPSEVFCSACWAHRCLLQQRHAAHTNVAVTKWSIYPHSHERQQCKYCRNVQGYHSSYGTLQSLDYIQWWWVFSEVVSLVYEARKPFAAGIGLSYNIYWTWAALGAKEA